MSESRTSKRRYTSIRRQAQAAETRRHIITAARKLFADRGYAGTTIEDIAREAGIAVQTIYTSFGSKRAILTRLAELTIENDEALAPKLIRLELEAEWRETSQRRQLESFAHEIGHLIDRVGPILEIMHTAAKTEPEIATFLRQLLENRLQHLNHLVGWMTANGPLREDLDLKVAAETVWVLTSAEVYRLLTIDRGWSRDQFERWLSGTLIRLLLP